MSHQGIEKLFFFFNDWNLDKGRHLDPSIQTEHRTRTPHF